MWSEHAGSLLRLCVKHRTRKLLRLRRRISLIPPLLCDHLRRVCVLNLERTPRGALRNHAECDRLGRSEPRRAFAEVHFTRRTNAFQVSAVRCEVQIRLQNFTFAVVPLEFEGAQDLL